MDVEQFDYFVARLDLQLRQSRRLRDESAQLAWSSVFPHASSSSPYHLGTDRSSRPEPYQLRRATELMNTRKTLSRALKSSWMAVIRCSPSRVFTIKKWLMDEREKREKNLVESYSAPEHYSRIFVPPLGCSLRVMLKNYLKTIL